MNQRETAQPLLSSSRIAIQRLIHQQLVQPSFTTPAEVVRWMGAMQAQDFLGSLWAIGCRLPQSTEQAVEQAIAERSIVRTWPMRGTVHFVPAEDARWMVQLMAPKVILRYQSTFRKLGLNDEVLASSREVFARALAGGKQCTRQALYSLLEAQGISTASSRGLHIIGRMALEGMICFAARAGKQPTFALLEEWCPTLRSLPRDEAASEMALRYFQSHGPATIQDFTWWTGLTVADAQAAVKAVKSRLTEATMAGKKYFWVELTMNPPVQPPAIQLLAPFDEYMVSYKDRSAALDPQNIRLLAPQRHLGPIIVIDGVVIGNWKRTFKNGMGVIQPTWARALTGTEDKRFEAAAQQYSKFLDTPVVLA